MAVSTDKGNPGKPHIRDLTRDECTALLARNNVGRIAFSFHDRVDIEPIHFVYDSGWLYGRTSQGTKLTTIEHHRWVAFEVDEVQGLFDWQSVVVKGAFYIAGPDDPIHHDVAFARGVELLRSLLPQTLTSADPVPFRRWIFRIHLDEVTGRESRSG